MLTITIQGEEFWDEDAEQFCYKDSRRLDFEHSLVSLSKWESKFHKLFLTSEQRSEEEMLGYIEAMLLTPDVPPDVLRQMTEEQVRQIDAYINDPMTGTTISNLPHEARTTSERLSSELFYFWMSQYQIPIQAESWHFNRLLTLIKVHYAKTQKPKKMSRQTRVQTMAELNAQRKAKLGTSG